MESSQRLDNTRTHRNNLANALSTLSTSVGAEPGQERSLSSTGSYQMPPASSESALKGGEEKKVKEKFLNNSGDNELHKDYKKRRPPTVLKSHNVQCLPNSYVSSPVTETPSSPAPNAPFIPSDHSSQDVKQLNGCKYATSTNSTTKANPIPAVSTEHMRVDADSVKRETKSHKEASDSGAAPKGKSKQIENRQRLKQKTGSFSPVTAETQAPVETIATKEHLNGSKRLSETETIDHQPLSNAASPSCVSSRRSKKQNKHKDVTYSKIPQHVDSPCCELNQLTDDASPDLANVTRKTDSKVRNSVEEQSSGRISTTQKDKKLEPMKSSSVWPGGYTSTSGVAELDTFEITSVRNQKQATKRATADKRTADHVEVSSVNAVNALDTFEEPVPRPVACRSVQASSSSAVQKERDMDEKWIEVNRKVKRVVVPSGVVSRILGSNGSKLEAICQVTRAHIELEKTSNPNETIFVLRGTLEQMQAASNMISALMKDCKSSDNVKSGNIPQVKNGSSVHLLLQPVSAKPISVTTSKEMKTSVKLGQSSVPSVTNNAILEKSSPPVPQINGYSQNDEDYPDSVQSSVSEQSDPCSERCSPAQDLLIGEYSLFEHGLGQPLEKLLARKDSSKQTFARAAAIRTPSRTLTPIIPNHSAIDQVLLAKAPGYRNAKAIYGRDSCFPKAVGLGSRMPNGRFGWPAFSGRGSERFKENDLSRCTTSHLFGIGSSNSHIPPVERPLSAPGFPSTPSCSSSAGVHGAVPHDRLAAPSHHVMAMQTFSNLNPNAPDFVFTLPLEEASSRIPKQCGPHLDGVPVDPCTDNSGCAHSNGSTGEFSYSMSQLGNGFESLSVDLPDSAPGGAVGRDVGFTLPRSGSDEGMYVPALGGDNLNAPWLCSQESWHPSKMSYGEGRGEQVVPGTTSNASYPSRGELYRNYFAHPPFSSTSSPYNCAFYQQQNVMLAPVQSWSRAAQTLAQAGP